MLPFQRTSHLRSLEMLAGHIVVGVCQSRIFVRKNDRTKAWHAWREAHINYLHDCVDPKVLNISVTPKREFVHFEISTTQLCKLNTLIINWPRKSLVKVPRGKTERFCWQVASWPVHQLIWRVLTSTWSVRSWVSSCWVLTGTSKKREPLLMRLAPSI